MYSSYYQAQAVKETLWFVIGVMRNEEDLVFTRTLDVKKNVVEFFVPQGYESRFEELTAHLVSKGYLVWVEKKENRLKTEGVYNTNPNE